MRFYALCMGRGTNKGKAGAGQVRIIAGDWRGRKLPVPALPGLRPTGDRVRETLFNWLQPYAPGGFVYVEAAARMPELVMQPPFELWRERVLGDVRMRLFRRAPVDAPDANERVSST